MLKPNEHRDALLKYARHYVDCIKVLNVGYKEGPESKIIDFTPSIYDHIKKADINWILGIKPILRPISSLTDNEADQIGRICFSRDSVPWRVKHNSRGYVSLYRKHYENEIVITYENGDVDFYDKDGPRHSMNGVQVFDWLTRNGFDVFGWISEGIAIAKED